MKRIEVLLQDLKERDKYILMGVVMFLFFGIYGVILCVIIFSIYYIVNKIKPGVPLTQEEQERHDMHWKDVNEKIYHPERFDQSGRRNSNHPKYYYDPIYRKYR